MINQPITSIDVIAAAVRGANDGVMLMALVVVDGMRNMAPRSGMLSSNLLCVGKWLNKHVVNSGRSQKDRNVFDTYFIFNAYFIGNCFKGIRTNKLAGFSAHAVTNVVKTINT